VAVLGTIGGLAKTGELTVMRACGISLYRLALPLLLLGAAWSGFLFVMEERVLAVSNQKAEALDDTIRGAPPHTVNVVSNQHWLAGPNGRLYHYQAYDQSRQVLMGLSVFETSRDPYRLDRHTFARTATYSDGTWKALEGWQRDFTLDGSMSQESFTGRTLQLTEPGDFAGAQVDAALMNVGELRQYLARLEGSGFNLTEQRMELQKKLAFPAVTLVMTLIAVPFGVTTGRRGALYGIGLAIGLAFSYFLLVAFFTAAGRAGVLPPVVAAWAANVFFLIVAGYMTLTVRT
jgi:LPS export ABC transporter permease LptG